MSCIYHDPWCRYINQIIYFIGFFYSGLVRQKNAAATIFQSIATVSVVAIRIFNPIHLEWWFWGFSLAFSTGSPIFGDLRWFMLIGFNGEDTTQMAHPNAPTIPMTVYFLYQLMFASITPALITGGMAERLKFTTWLVFSTLWVTLVYCPIAHMMWAQDGWMKGVGMLDWAGGYVVHITSGTTALVFSIFMKKRKDAKTVFTWLYDKLFQKKKTIILHWGEVKTPVINHSIPQMLLGTTLIWFGWFGFNGGGSLSANNGASLALTNTFLASCSAGTTWMLIDLIVRGKAKITGMCEGVIAGLIAITPCAGFVHPGYAVLIGIIIAIICPVVITLKGYAIDDTLDAVGLHLTGGVVGCILTAIFASKKIALSSVGLVHPGGCIDGNWVLLGWHIVGILVVIGWSFIMSFILFWALRPLGWNVGAYEERVGLDVSQHDETSYVYEAPEKPEPHEDEKKEFSIHDFIKSKIYKQKGPEVPMNDINVNE